MFKLILSPSPFNKQTKDRLNYNPYSSLIYLYVFNVIFTIYKCAIRFYADSTLFFIYTLTSNLTLSTASIRLPSLFTAVSAFLSITISIVIDSLAGRYTLL